ncbi:MAG: cell division protein ZapA [Paludibacteraceae bacterium]|nr:cell division protein ZapA [Paludibacteraceae bacterium]
MADGNKLKINLKIGSLLFSPFVDRSEEEVYRKATDYINSKIDTLRKSRSNLTEAQNLSIVALELALELMKTDNDRNEIFSAMKDLDDMLKSATK